MRRNQVIVRPGSVASPGDRYAAVARYRCLPAGDWTWIGSSLHGANLVLGDTVHELRGLSASRMTFMAILRELANASTLAPGIVTFELVAYTINSVGRAYRVEHVGIANSARGGERGTLRSITLPLKRV